MAEHLVQPRLDTRADGALETGRLLVGFGPTETNDRGQQPLEQRVPAEDAVRCGPAGVGEDQLAAARLGDKAIRHEPSKHLRTCLRTDAEVPGDQRGTHPGAVAGHHSKGQQVLARGTREIVLAGSFRSVWHDLMVRAAGAVRLR
jgi:hypothetical protein